VNDELVSAFCRLVAMPLPIMPSPMNPTFMCSSNSWRHCGRSDAISFRQTLIPHEIARRLAASRNDNDLIAVPQLVIDRRSPASQRASSLCASARRSASISATSGGSR